MMAVQLHEQSAPGMKSELDLFSVPPTQVTAEQGSWSQIQLCNPVTDTGPYKFNISRDNMMLDLNKNFLRVKLRIVGADGAALTDDPPVVAPINYIAATFFKQIIVKLGDKEVYNSGSLYPYQAYLETLLNYGSDTKNGQLSGGLWRTDTMSPDTLTDNPAFTYRAKMCKNSSDFEVVAPIHCDIFNQERYMLSNMPLSIELHRNDDAFCLQSGAAVAYKLKVKDMQWYVRKVKIQDSLSLAMEQLMREQGMTAKYPIRRVKMVNRHMPQGIMSHMETNVFNGQLPRRLIFGLVASNSFNGTYLTSPLRFQNNDMSEVCVWVGDQQHGPIRMNYGSNCYNLPFEMLFQGCGLAKEERSNGISYISYKDWCCLYAFDLTPDNSDSAALQLLREGSVNIEFRFNTALRSPVELIVYGEFDNLITVDWNRNVFFDYSV